MTASGSRTFTSQTLHCLHCGAELRQGRRAGFTSDGEPFYLWVCPNDHWWNFLAWHSMWVRGKYL